MTTKEIIKSREDNEKPCILIVDDREENLHSLERVLKYFEADIIRATSGQEALAMLLHREFALILLDVMMPEMDGFETAELIRNHKDTGHIPIILVTAASEDKEFIFKGYESGAVDFLFKPIDENMLIGKVKIFLDMYNQSKNLKNAIGEMERVNKLMIGREQKMMELKAEIKKLRSIKQR
jgi:two-component system cell cycle response regulator